MLDALVEAGVYDQSIVLVHGDHGSRLDTVSPATPFVDELRPQDYVDAFSTLFAAKLPGVSGGTDRRLLPLEELVAAVVRDERLPEGAASEPPWVWVDVGRRPPREASAPLVRARARGNTTVRVSAAIVRRIHCASAPRAATALRSMRLMGSGLAIIVARPSDAGDSMRARQIGRLLRTVSHLRASQVWHRARLTLRRKRWSRRADAIDARYRARAATVAPLRWDSRRDSQRWRATAPSDAIRRAPSRVARDALAGRFTFLGRDARPRLLRSRGIVPI